MPRVPVVAVDDNQTSHLQLTVKVRLYTVHQYMHTMEESQTLKNGQTYLQNKRTIMLGISPGNPFYYKVDNLQRLFRFAETNTHKKVRFVDSKIIGRKPYCFTCKGKKCHTK